MSLRGISLSRTRKQNGHWQSGKRDDLGDSLVTSIKYLYPWATSGGINSLLTASIEIEKAVSLNKLVIGIIFDILPGVRPLDNLDGNHGNFKSIELMSSGGLSALGHSGSDVVFYYTSPGATADQSRPVNASLTDYRDNCFSGGTSTYLDYNLYKVYSNNTSDILMIRALKRTAFARHSNNDGSSVWYTKISTDTAIKLLAGTVTLNMEAGYYYWGQNANNHDPLYCHIFIGNGKIPLDFNLTNWGDV